MSKKGAKTQQNYQQSYEVRDVVLAKVRGFPPWPGMVSAFPAFRRVSARHIHRVSFTPLTLLFLRA